MSSKVGINYYYKLLKQRIVFIAVPILLGITTLIILWIFSRPIYVAELVYMVNEEEAGASQFAGLISDFGLGQLGGVGSESNPERILEIAKSSIVIIPCLLDTATIDGQKDLIANAIIKIYNLDQELQDNLYKNYPEASSVFLSTSDLSKLPLAERWVLKKLITLVRGSSTKEGIVGSSFDEDTGIMELRAMTTSEDLSIILSRRLFYELSQYYIQKAVEPQQNTYDIIEQKVDSLARSINLKSSQLAELVDSRRRLIDAKSKLEEKSLERELQIAYVGYGKAIENQEVAEFSLRTQTPYFQPVSEPMAPLEPEDSSLIQSLGITVFFIGFLSVACIVLVDLIFNNEV